MLQGSYEAGYLVNEAGADWWKLNDPNLTPQMFSPKGAAMGAPAPKHNPRGIGTLVAMQKTALAEA